MSIDQWPDPKRILLLTYDRLDHLSLSVDEGVIGVAEAAGNASKANKLRPGDWVLLRLTEYKELADHLLVYPPARVTGFPLLQGKRNSPWPDLLWPEEIETKSLKYVQRVPVAFDSHSEWAPHLTWQSLAALRLKGNDGTLLETPGQWGIKFLCNVIEAPYAQRMVALIRKHSAIKSTPSTS